MSFPSKDEVLAACERARRLGYAIRPSVTIAPGCCCPLGAVIIARGLQSQWIEGVCDWLDLADLLDCDPDEVQAFTEAYEGAPGAEHPLISELPEGLRGHLASPGD